MKKATHGESQITCVLRWYGGTLSKKIIIIVLFSLGNVRLRIFWRLAIVRGLWVVWCESVEIFFFVCQIGNKKREEEKDICVFFLGLVCYRVPHVGRKCFCFVLLDTGKKCGLKCRIKLSWRRRRIIVILFNEQIIAYFMSVLVYVVI